MKKEFVWKISEDSKYSQFKELYLVNTDGEIVAKVRESIDTFFFGDKEYISEKAAKTAAEKTVGAT